MSGAALVVAVLAIAACQSSSRSSSSLQPTVVEPPSKTETFSGIVPVNGSSSSPFTISQAGTLAITLTAAGPPSTIFMGLGVGAPDANGVCQLFPTGVVSAQGSTTPQLSGTVSQTGAYCVSVFDIGNQSDTVTYSVTVTHPI
ncbi:MAG TPA: hypothetical protein VGY57_03970 [Vicinamibacterales bacterium]|nr:hypothetical protein [Vicinamibacterales bacterium]